jgi:hypothetical protein
MRRRRRYRADSVCLLLLASALLGPTPLALVYVGNRNTLGQPSPQVNVISYPLCKVSDMQIISAVFAGSVISEGDGK